MSLPITSDRLAAVYDMLQTFPPFSRWGLPKAQDVKFHVAKTVRWHAAWWIEGNTHHIEVSGKKHAHLASLVCSMAHEMIHVRQRIAKTETNGTEHNAEFKHLGTLVCRRFGFDAGQFLG
jgi:hypothetical protein